MKKRFLVGLLILSLLAILVAGCGGGGKTGEEKVVRYNHGQEPETIDPIQNTSTDGGTIAAAVFEGLTALDADNKSIPGVAENWDISPDGMTYTFHLRKDAKWSDGKPVTAKDFAYSWQRALDPNTKAEYAYQLFYIKNGEEFNAGNAKAEDLGIKVIDENTLEVTLNAPTPYFLNLTSFPTLMPVRQDIIEKNGDQWARKAETYIGNGPFKAVEWVSKDHLKLVKNGDYWDKDRVKIAGIMITFIGDESTMLSSYEAGELDVIDSIPLTEIARLKKESNELNIIPQAGTYYYAFNTQKAPFDNVKVRKAFALAIDRQTVVDKIRKTGTPATGFVPFGIPDATPDKDFRSVGGDFFPVKADVAQAKKLLAEAGYPGGKGFPEVTLIYNSTEEHKILAEAMLEMWKQNLGISNIKLANMEWGVFIPTRQKGDFQIARDGWIGDYNDPMTFIDLFTTDNGNNDPQWKNAEFDQLVKKARTASNEQERMSILHQAEKLFLDEAIMAPVFFYTQNSMVKPYVKNLHVSPLGFTYFDRVEISQ
ncbi:peptide ABC transporter substrate-binding protein [Syntrophomonas erecta subsp. sporosyntropha]